MLLICTALGTPVTKCSNEGCAEFSISSGAKEQENTVMINNAAAKTAHTRFAEDFIVSSPQF